MNDRVGLDTMKALLDQLEDTFKNGAGVSGVESSGTGEGKERNEKGKEGGAIKMSERFNEDDADVMIISSDGIGIKVHSFLLTRASPVFKNMITFAKSDTQRDPITLTDELVEVSLVVQATFEILYDREVASFKNGNLYHHVIEFARKWDMPVILKTLSTQILVHTNSEGLNTYVNQVFGLATDLGEPKLLTAIMRSKVGRAWGDPVPNPEEGISKIFKDKSLCLGPPILKAQAQTWLKGAPCFKLGGWPYAKFAAVPTPIVWALLRASENTDLAFKGHVPEHLLMEFQKLMDSMYPQKSKHEVGAPPAV